MGANLAQILVERAARWVPQRLRTHLVFFIIAVPFSDDMARLRDGEGGGQIGPRKDSMPPTLAYSRSICAYSPLEGSFYGPKGEGEALVQQMRVPRVLCQYRGGD